MTSVLSSHLAAAHSTTKPLRARPQRHEREKRRQLAQQLLPLEQPSAPEQSTEHKNELDWTLLAREQVNCCPVVFSTDRTYCFIASGSHVKIYHSETTELLSTLASSSRAQVTSVVVHPSNPRQLVVSLTDGLVRVWDYVEGRLVRTLDCQSPVVHATAHPTLPDQLFVALANPSLVNQDKAKAKDATEDRSSVPRAPSNQDDPLCGVYLVSLRPKRSHPTASSSTTTTVVDPSTPVLPNRRIRLALPRPIRTLSLSPDGSTLVSLTPRAIHLCRTDRLEKGFTKTVPSTSSMTAQGGRDDQAEEVFTTLAFHPTETVFATGNTKGQVRVWYNVLERSSKNPSETSTTTTSTTTKNAAAVTTSILHWHVHPISSLAFTPNGAYLLSGGQESVIVLWQLSTNHQEYIPRLGGPVRTLTVVDGAAGGRDSATRGGGGEQMVVARLEDGSVVFVGSQRLKIEKTIAGLKSDVIAPGSNSTSTGSPWSRRPLPLSVDPATHNLVLPSGHPSSLQFYSPSNDAQVLELEVSPSNRVSGATRGKVVEPTRVERVAFSNPEKDHHGAYWMATVDEWSSLEYNDVRQLKFWRNKGESQAFSLSTRIDRPHSASLSSLTFSPSPHQPLLLTTSLDKTIKLWALSSSSNASWHCRTSLSRRGLTPLASAFSADGSMFAVAFQGGSVSVWGTARVEEIFTFGGGGDGNACGTPREIVFAGDEGTELVCVGSEGTVAWDLLTLEETFSSSIAYSCANATSTGLVVAECSTASTGSTSFTKLPLASSSSSSSPSTSLSPATEPYTLPFSITQSIAFPTASTSTSTSREPPSLAVIDGENRVVLVGPLAKSAGSIAPSRLPQATEGQTRLFDEIFGSSSDQVGSTSNSAQTALASSSKGKGKGTVGRGGKGLEILETPAHSLPPVKLLWRSMLLASPPSTAASLPAKDDDDDASGVAGMDIEGGGRQVEDLVRDRGGDKVEHDRSVVYSDQTPGSIASIFRARLTMEVLHLASQLFTASDKNRDKHQAALQLRHQIQIMANVNKTTDKIWEEVISRIRLLLTEKEMTNVENDKRYTANDPRPSTATLIRKIRIQRAPSEPEYDPSRAFARTLSDAARNVGHALWRTASGSQGMARPLSSGDPRFPSTSQGGLDRDERRIRHLITDDVGAPATTMNRLILQQLHEAIAAVEEKLSQTRLMPDSKRIYDELLEALEERRVEVASYMHEQEERKARKG
ncbi:hypothetical protein JCM10212_002127 [Sporobolomyces blumeae]